MVLEPLFVSTGLVALAETGDKTQLLTLVLAARFRRRRPIVLGILAATVLNHAFAAWIGNRLGAWLTPGVLRGALGASFLAMAGWTLIPDTLDERETSRREGSRSAGSVFAATTIAFFVAEMGDKTQFATVALAARYESALAWVVAGTTLGMLLANAPVVWLGEALCRRIPLRTVRATTAVLFAALGAATLLWRG